ncbi:MAG: deoxyribose-phosphate aldolase [Paludibacteraceae bacterium]|nr:deoxyribose-phosphate aldolase [Paludibacteraceae bacterium]
MKNFNTLFSSYKCAVSDKVIAEKTKKILEDNFDSNNTVEVYKTLFSIIDLTSLNNTDYEENIRLFTEKVNNFPEKYPEMPNVAAICVYPAYAEIVKDTLVEDVEIAAVSAGFPSSQTFIEIKVAETALAINAGASEIDVVISIGKFLNKQYDDVFEEIEEIKATCTATHLKVILETGALVSAEEIKKASVLSMEAGADFIKTSTGKMNPAATLEAAYIMCEAIKDFYKKTGVKVGFKPAGGIVTTKDAVEYYCIVKEILGDEWLTKDLFRLGASRLANNLLSDIYKTDIAYF